MKKSLCSLLAVSLTVSGLVTYPKVALAKNTSIKTITLSSAKDLQNLQNSIDEANADEIVILVNEDISYTSKDWEAVNLIGENVNSRLKVTVKGNNHIIYGLCNAEAADSAVSAAGLFNACYADLSVYDLTLKNASIYGKTEKNGQYQVVTGDASNAGMKAGVFAGALNYGSYSFENCQVSNGSVYGSSYLGSFVGYSNMEINMNNCSSDRTCQVNSCSYNKSDSYYVGGICGYVAACKFNKVTNQACISGSGINTAWGIGGLVGGNRPLLDIKDENKTTVGTAYFKDCCNDGDLVLDFGFCVGGIIGCGDAYIESCQNNGNITNKTGSRVGGILGYGNADIKSCENTGDISGLNITSGNTVSDIRESDFVGGIVGYYISGTMEDVKNSGEITGDDCVGGIAGYSSGTIQSSVNKGNVSGDVYVGGTVGVNNGSISDALNSGKVTGNSEVAGNVGKDVGTSSELTDLSNNQTAVDGLSENGTIISTIVDLNSEGEVSAFGMTFAVNPVASGMIGLVDAKKDGLTLLAIPAAGYKFTGWTLSGNSQLTTGNLSDLKISISKAKDSKVVANFSKISTGETIVDVNTNTYEVDGTLVITATPAQGGSVNYVNSSDGSISLIAVAADGYEFDKWEVSGSANFAEGVDAKSATATFTYSKNTSGKLVACFKASVETVGMGSEINDGLYRYKITKAGSKKTKGQVKLLGLYKKNLKKVKVATTIKVDGITYQVTSIAKKAFYKNNKITSVVIGKNVKTIGNLAFAKMKKLKKVTICSKKLSKLCKSVFSGDKKLARLVIKSKKLKSIGMDCFKNTKKGLVIKVPASKKKAYAKLIKKSKAKNVIVK